MGLLFCSSCGKPLSADTYKFCAACGSQVVAKPSTVKIASVNWLFSKKIIWISIACLSVVIVGSAVLFALFSNRGELSGVWDMAGRRGTATSIQFRGRNQFNVILYAEALYYLPSGTFISRHGRPYRIVSGQPPWGAISSEWELIGLNYWRIMQTGTYSISDNRIEFVFSDGTIRVMSFTRTENTIEIDRARFNRRR